MGESGGRSSWVRVDGRLRRKIPEELTVSPVNYLRMLPVEILLRILDHLCIQDIVNLTRTSKDLHKDITDTFELRETTMSVFNNHIVEQVTKDDKQILSLCSNVNIQAWEYQDWLRSKGDGTHYIEIDSDTDSGEDQTDTYGRGNFENLLKDMKLKYVRNVKFIGTNYGTNDHRGLLIPLYKSAMRNIFINKEFIQKLEISVDTSQECFNYLGKLKNMKFLKKLILRSSQREALYGIRDGPITLSKMLKNTLDGLGILYLRLRNFGTVWLSKNSNVFELESATIQSLQIEQMKGVKLGGLNVPNLTRLNYEGFWGFCLWHEQTSDLVDHGGMAEMLSENCPVLNYYNSLDLNKLRKESPTGKWIDVLKITLEKAREALLILRMRRTNEAN